MGYILSLQALDRRDGESRDPMFVSRFSATICQSLSSATIC